MSLSLTYSTRNKKKGRVTFLTFIEISLVEITLGHNHCLGGERKLCLKVLISPFRLIFNPSLPYSLSHVTAWLSQLLFTVEFGHRDILAL